MVDNSLATVVKPRCSLRGERVDPGLRLDDDDDDDTVVDPVVVSSFNSGDDTSVVLR